MILTSYGFHLPLDAHPIHGNAAQLATSLGATVVPYGSFEGEPTGVEAKFDPPLTPAELKSKAETHLNKTIIHAPAESEKIERMGIITGGAIMIVRSCKKRNAGLHDGRDFRVQLAR